MTALVTCWFVCLFVVSFWEITSEIASFFDSILRSEVSLERTSLEHLFPRLIAQQRHAATVPTMSFCGEQRYFWTVCKNTQTWRKISALNSKFGLFYFPVRVGKSARFSFFIFPFSVDSLWSSFITLKHSVSKYKSRWNHPLAFIHALMKYICAFNQT